MIVVSLTLEERQELNAWLTQKGKGVSLAAHQAIVLKAMPGDFHATLQSISVLKFRPTLQAALFRAGIDTVEVLREVPEELLVEISGIGTGSVGEIRKALAAHEHPGTTKLEFSMESLLLPQDISYLQLFTHTGAVDLKVHPLPQYSRIKVLGLLRFSGKNASIQQHAQRLLWGEVRFKKGLKREPFRGSASGKS